MQTILESDVERQMLLQEEKQLQNQENSGTRLAEIYDRLNEIESWNAEARACEILCGLQFTTDMQQQPTRSLSGGWRMRVNLSCALFCKPDLLLLDEVLMHTIGIALTWMNAVFNGVTVSMCL